MVSTKVLASIGGVGGVITVFTGYTLQGILQKRVRDSAVYKEAMKVINNHPAGINYLGVPVRSTSVNVSNNNNILSLRYCQLELPVYGPKSKGILYLWADRLTAEEVWNIYKLELEPLDNLGGRVTLINKEPVLKSKSVD